MESPNISPSEISLVGLAVEYCRMVDNASEMAPHDFLRDVLRYLPRFYITLTDLAGSRDTETDENDAIYQILTEEDYDAVRESMATVFGEYDVYLDTPVEDMRFSDTPVGVSLSEQLADIYQNFSDFAATVQQIPSELIGSAVDDMIARFRTYLSETICSALRAANYIYQNKLLDREE